jgi:hypothetical protein
VAENREHKVGKIEVVFYEAYSRVEKQPRHNHQALKVDFSQANKRDVSDVTKMKYAMATTRVGRLMKDGKVCEEPKVKTETLEDKKERAKPYDRTVVKKKKPQKEEELKERLVWRLGGVVKTMCVEYHMTQTLVDWGITPTRLQWGNGGNVSLKAE